MRTAIAILILAAGCSSNSAQWSECEPSDIPSGPEWTTSFNGGVYPGQGSCPNGYACTSFSGVRFCTLDCGAVRAWNETEEHWETTYERDPELVCEELLGERGASTSCVGGCNAGCTIGAQCPDDTSCAMGRCLP